MAENNELIIVLKLLDQASGEIKKAMGDAGKEVDKLADKTKKQGKETQNAFQASSKAIRDFRREMLFVTVVLGALTVATKEYATRNSEVRDSLDELGVAFKNVVAWAGQYSPLLVAIRASSGAVKEFNDNMAGKDAGTNINRATNQLKNFNEELKNQGLLFQAGFMPASEYYNKLVEAQGTILSQNISISSNFQQLAQLQSEVGNEQLLNTRSQIKEQIDLLNEYKENFQTAHAGMASFVTLLSSNIRTNLSSAITGVITGTKNASEAFKEFGLTMIEAVVNFMVQKVIAFALEKTLLAGTVAATSAAAAALAAAWAPAAIAANIATLGGAASAAAATFPLAAASFTAATMGASAAQKASGSAGLNSLFGASNINARATGGDDIVTRPTIFLAGENGPERVKVDPLNYPGGGDAGGVNINIYYPNFTSKDSIRQVSEDLGFEIERSLRGARSTI